LKTPKGPVFLIMTTSSKQEYLIQIHRRYQRAGRRYKGRILDEFCAVCGYERKWAVKLLNRPLRVNRRRGGAPRRYGPELVTPLKTVWLAAQQPCGKRLKAALPLWLPHSQVTASQQERLLQASAATLDRLLRPLRARHPKGRCGTKPGGVLKTQIPLRTSHADIDRPGYLEADTVAHCGGSLAGDFAWTLTLTDIDSGWTCLRAVWNKGQHGVHAAIRAVEQTLPFPLLGFDSDNGGEFLNHHLHRYLGDRQTRSRPGHKNDNAHVEQKNWTHARQLLGYDRLGNPDTVPFLNRLLATWEELQNYCCPAMKLATKHRTGAKVTRRHDTATTPCDRLLASPHVTEAAKAQLRQHRAQLNPFALSRQIEQQLKQVWRANRQPAATPVVLRTPCAAAGLAV
jgi:hypothetical protein